MLACGDGIPSVGPVIDTVRKKAFVRGICGEIRLFEKTRHHREASLRIDAAFIAECVAQAQQTLRGDGAGRGVNGLEGVEGIGRARLPVAQSM